MKKIIEYTVVYASGSEEDFIGVVNSHVDDGWQPIGGVSIKPAGFGITSGFYQTMVKYEEEIH